MHDLTDRSASVFRYKGPHGRLRVSARHLDETLSSEPIPVHSFDRVEKLHPGDVVEVEIDLFPTGLVFYPGQQLRLVVTAENTLGAITQTDRAYQPDNQGRHVIHTGGPRASYLQLPIQTAHQL